MQNTCFNAIPAGCIFRRGTIMAQTPNGAHICTRVLSLWETLISL